MRPEHDGARESQVLGLPNEGPFAALDLENPDSRQALDRIPNDRSTYAEHFREFAFGRQLVPWFQFLRGKEPLNFLDDLIGEETARDTGKARS
jgi:hypothetical protein